MDCSQMQVRSEERDRGSFGMTHEHCWIVFIVTVVATIAAGIVSFLLPSVYQATVSLIPPGDILQDEAQLAVRMGIGRNSAAGRSIAITSIADVYVGLLKSRVVADGVIEKCGLMDAYGPGESRDKVRLRLTRNAMVKLSGSGIITLTVEDRDPGRAASIANAYVEELDRQSKRLSVERAAGKRVFLENRLHEIDRLLSRIDSLPSREVRIKDTLFDLLSREREMAEMQEARDIPTVQVIDRAIAAEAQCRPERGQMVVLCAMTSLFLAAFIVHNLEHLVKIKPNEGRVG